jgi:hypothetical protein
VSEPLPRTHENRLHFPPAVAHSLNEAIRGETSQFVSFLDTTPTHPVLLCTWLLGYGSYSGASASHICSCCCVECVCCVCAGVHRAPQQPLAILY